MIKPRVCFFAFRLVVFDFFDEVTSLGITPRSRKLLTSLRLFDPGDNKNICDDGVLSNSDLVSLKNTNGTEFDRLFFSEMLGHPESAEAMSKAVLEDGANPRARALAESIVSSQTEEIAWMKELSQ